MYQPVYVPNELTASVEVVGPVGQWSGAERLSTCPQACGRSRRSGSRGLPGLGFGGLAVGPVSLQAPGAVEDGQRSVWILVHPDRGLDVVAAVAVSGELQDLALVAHGVVV